MIGVAYLLLFLQGAVGVVRLTPGGSRLATARVRPRTAVACSEEYAPAKLEDPSVGQIVPCKIMEANEQGGYRVDIGASSFALLPAQEVLLNANASVAPGENAQGTSVLPVGGVFEGQVLSTEGGEVTVSLAAVHRNLAWRRVVQLQAADATYVGKVLRVGKAGVTLDVEQLPAFVPWSHWHLPQDEQCDGLVGSELKVKMLEVDRPRNRLVVSHRRFQLQERLEVLRPGQLIDGTIASVRPYGAVVTIADGLDGLLHISQVSNVFVRDIAAVLDVGEKIRCVVIKVDPADGSVNLSTKMLEEKAGDVLKDREAVFARANAIETIALSGEAASV